tara:strand:+ start:147 stop:536 length:390 start_codon:yes stop_codon:yes gene_type:complete
MFSPIIKASLIAVLGFVAATQSYALNVDAQKLDEQTFAEKVVGVTWYGSYNETYMTFNKDGTISGEGKGKVKGKIKGTWAWEGKKWCREVSLGSTAIPKECQTMYLMGDKVLVNVTKSNPKGVPYIRKK